MVRWRNLIMMEMPTPVSPILAAYSDFEGQKPGKRQLFAEEMFRRNWWYFATPVLADVSEIHRESRISEVTSELPGGFPLSNHVTNRLYTEIGQMIEIDRFYFGIP
ncbi:unnamed protein product [Haemonchus placei]|uniref:Bestrophin homolog n=1 Tax=Haemonchus placei TaxID=6290 RepID=A0A0N4W7I3_HAEPC|nr:unnamed protein product [Haemonchus placei]